MQPFYKKLNAEEQVRWDETRRRAWERLSPEIRTSRQVLGRRIGIGCVALEITQRCNLDCTLCYLSDLSESIPDPPMEELKRRADMIVEEWGPNTNVQITGGDPTLRKREELVEIVRYCRSIGLLPALFTNGILARRDLLEELASVGLVDVAFHVDMTQERPGYKSELELNEVRREYIERARGLALAIVFNTTVFDGNAHEIPELVRFFRRNADVVGMCSFQLGADTGRGTNDKGTPVGHSEVRKIIDTAFAQPLKWDAVQFGHPKCHSIAYTLQVGDESIDLGDEPELIEASLAELPNLEMDRTRPWRAALSNVVGTLSKPALRDKGTTWFLRTMRKHWKPLVKSGFRAHKLSVFIQNFMGADQLEAERVANCSFMVATAQGTMSMCLHNARRNEFLLIGVDRLVRNPVKRGRVRDHDARLPPELQGTVSPGAAGLPEGFSRTVSTPPPAETVASDAAAE
jgi:hypothetical protein